MSKGNSRQQKPNKDKTKLAGKEKLSMPLFIFPQQKNNRNKGAWQAKEPASKMKRTPKRKKTPQRRFAFAFFLKRGLFAVFLFKLNGFNSLCFRG